MKRPLYIMQEHNEAFYVWKKAFDLGVIHSDCRLMHFDDHADFRSPVLNTSVFDIAKAPDVVLKKFVQGEVHIDSFLVPAVYLGIINEVTWFRQGGLSTTEDTRYVRTFNGEGKCFLAGSQSVGTSDERSFVYRRSGSATADMWTGIPGRSILLDIDLDYFSCCENPYIQNEIVIEITEGEYGDFISNPYHYLHFITAKAEVKECNGSYFYILNSVEDKYQSRREVSESEIINRIGNLVNFLNDAEISPGIITVCRSFFSGFTPRHQVDFIQRHLLDALGQLYDLEIRQVYGECNKEEKVLC